MPRSNNSTLRRFRKADRLLQTSFFVIRPCSYCFTRGFLCVLSSEFPHCERCFRINRQCELAPFDAEIERLHKKAKKLFNGAKEARAKTIYLAKQRRAVLKRFRALSDREDQNIFKLELDEIVDLKTDKQLRNVPEGTFPEVLNLSSPRFSSFLNLTLLGSPDRTFAEPLNS